MTASVTRSALRPELDTPEYCEQLVDRRSVMDGGARAVNGASLALLA
jgi:hypothetical protein